ncbi:hypothetical protein UK23_29615 [Lentzea aerocolonigenes]|uniref:Uncharacterized protein n=1 Tax=Lentzea aerocolonigenes TaxID=68170 RepID=A0A0F0GLK5_LENAE|nr:hypothetical protein UK23_29615 [Lentzea aerocolonigenes]
MQARAAVATRWAKATDREAETAPARKGFLAKLEREVDPEGVLPPEVRLQRAVELRRAHMLRASLKSAQVRRERREVAARGDVSR